jgi:2-keto-4-pentenoate hydratase/2-oxohepta-3-ene-1,7-dioic acid hydratase in catechol pathway
MILVTYEEGGEARIGVLDGESVIDARRAVALKLRAHGETRASALATAQVPADMTELLRGGPGALEAVRGGAEYAASGDLGPEELVIRPASSVRLLCPVPRPPKIVCVARNYAEHAREAGRELPEIPILFARFPVTLVAPGAPVVRPTVSHELDWEGELAVVIGRGGRHITREAAMDHVAGYTIFNDVTVRDYQFRVTQYTAGKNFSASGPLGPWLVLADEVADPHDLRITTTVSGELMQDGSTQDMIFDIPAIIEHVSEFVELEPGDVIPTGTPSGVGFTRKPPRFLVPGDTVRVEVSSLGVLENPVVDEEQLS